MVTQISGLPSASMRRVWFGQGALPPLQIHEARPFLRYRATRRGPFENRPTVESHAPANWDELLRQNPGLRATLESQFGADNGLWRILNRHKRQEAV